jgi:hypothetical protein
MVLVLPETAEPAPTNESGRVFRVDAAHSGRPRLATFQLGHHRVAVPERAEDDRQFVVAQLTDLAESFDLAEPFQRIREAIEEAQQAVR